MTFNNEDFINYRKSHASSRLVIVWFSFEGVSQGLEDQDKDVKEGILESGILESVIPGERW